MNRLATILALVAFVVSFQGNAFAHAAQGGVGLCAAITHVTQADGGEAEKGVVAPETSSPSCKIIGTQASDTRALAHRAERVRFERAEPVLTSCSLAGQKKPPKPARLTA